MELPECLSRLSSSVSLQSLQSYLSVYKHRSQLFNPKMFDTVVRVRGSSGFCSVTNPTVSIINLIEDGENELYIVIKKGTSKTWFSIGNSEDAIIDNVDKTKVKLPNDSADEGTIYVELRTSQFASSFKEKVNEELHEFRKKQNGINKKVLKLALPSEDSCSGGSADESASPSSDPAVSN